MSFSNDDLRNLISMPFIWAVLIPLLLLDIFLEIYHRICFPLYRLKYVRRSSYIKIDRHKLKYLTFLRKLGCVYCGYANGLLQYAAKIAGETEKYWCGIQHKEDPNFIPPPHHKDFPKYGDAEGFHKWEKQFYHDESKKE